MNIILKYVYDIEKKKKRKDSQFSMSQESALQIFTKRCILN